MMRCENNFCIYWENQTCTLSEISLDVGGHCESVILIDLEEDFLKNEREKALTRYEDQ